MDISYKMRLMLAIWLQLICNRFNFQKLTRKRIQYLSSNTVLSNTNAARIGTLLGSSSKYQFLLRLSISKKKSSQHVFCGGSLNLVMTAESQPNPKLVGKNPTNKNQKQFNTSQNVQNMTQFSCYYLQ